MRIWCLLSLMVSVAWAHPGSQDHLHATAEAPCGDSVTLVRRVQALVEDQRLARAMQEVETGRACGAQASAVDLAQAHVALAAGLDTEAVTLGLQVLEQETGHPGALRLVALAYTSLGQPDLAADRWLALARQSQGAPEAWLAAATQRQAAEQPARAAAHLDEAIDRLGPLAPLVTAAARYHHEAGQSQVARDRLMLLPESAAVWQIRADLSDDPQSVRYCLEQARQHVSAWRESPRKLRELEAIQTQLEQL